MSGEKMAITSADVGVLKVTREPAFKAGDTVTVKGKPGRGTIVEVRVNGDAPADYHVHYAADDAVHSPVKNWWPETELAE